MANVIKIKAGSGVPTTSNIVDRELAFNRSNNKLYINDSGTIVDLSGTAGGGSAEEADRVVFNAQAGEALSKGDVIYISGISGNTPIVSKADADDSAKMPAFGLASASASINTSVEIVTFGTLENFDTSSFSVGDTVYVSTTAGGLTATKPTGESGLIQNMGHIVRSHASTGAIKIAGSGRTAATPNLDQDKIFLGNASNQSTPTALSSIGLSKFNNDSGFTTNTGDIEGVTAGNGLTGGGTSGTVTLNIGAGTGIDVAADAISVDVSDFMSNGSNNRILTATGTDAMNAEANFTIDGTSLQLGDNKILSLGNSDDLQIHHTPNHNYIDINNGNLYFRDDADNNIFIVYREGGGIQLSEGDLKIPATSKLYLDGGSQTYITESQNDVMDFYVGGVQMLRMEESGTDYVTAPDNIRLSVGTGKDSQWYYSGTNTIFSANNSPSLYITQYTTDGDIIFQSDNGSGGTTNYLQIDGGAENIYVYKDLRLAATKKLFLDGGGNSYIQEESADNLIFRAGGGNYLRVTNSNIVLNDPSASYDVRIEGDTDSNLFFTDGSADKVGIGTNSPSQKLHVNGNIRTDLAYLVDGNIVINTDGNFEVHDTRSTTPSTDIGLKGVRFDFKSNSTDGLSDGGSYHGVMTFQQWNDTSGGHIHALGFTDNGYVHHRNASIGGTFGNWKKLIQEDESGNVGIGTTSPGDKLHIAGNVRIDGGDVLRWNGQAFIDTIGANDIFIRPNGSTATTITAGGNVGIGTTSPSVELHVKDASSHAQLRIETDSASHGAYLELEGSANKYQIYNVGGNLGIDESGVATRFTINSSGNVLIGGTSASGHGFNLEVLNDHAYVKGPDGWNGTGDKAIVALGSGVSNESFGCGYVYGTGLVLSTYKTSGGGHFGSSTQNSLIIADTTGQASFINDVVAYASSDKRLKENVKPLDNALDKINKINGVEFDWIDGKDEHGNSVHSNEGHDVGVIAQEIEEVLPEVVHTRDNGYKAVKYEKIVPLLIEAIKEQQQQINKLEEKLNG